jgi:hypothetical protein
MGVNVRATAMFREASTFPFCIHIIFLILSEPHYLSAFHDILIFTEPRYLSALHDTLFSTKPFYLSALHDILISTEPRYLSALHDTLFSTEPHYLPALHDSLFLPSRLIVCRFTIVYFLPRSLVQIYIRTLLFATNSFRSQRGNAARQRLGEQKMKFDRRRNVEATTELNFMLGSPSPLDALVRRWVLYLIFSVTSS